MRCSKCGAESVESDKFCVACGTPLVVPSMSEVKQPQTSQGEFPSGGHVSDHTKLLKLTCPSCGGALELPDNLTIAHCIYCGTKILLDQDSVVRERRDLQRYIDLCKVAVAAKNHKEAIEYCNRILEIDPKNVQAWVDKAISTFWLTTGANNRYDEAMEYLAKASQLAPDDSRVAQTREELTLQQALWYNHLGNQQWKLAMKTYNIEYEYYKRLAYVWPEHNAKVASAQHAVKAMDFWIMASQYAPSNIPNLKNIATCVNFYESIVKWDEEVYTKVKSLEFLRTRLETLNKLTSLEGELEKAQAELAALRTQTGFLAGTKIKGAENRISQLQKNIARLKEQDAALCAQKR